MIGVNLEILNALIKKNNLYANSFDHNSDKIVELINNFKNDYDGNILEYLFSGPINQVKNIKEISKIINNYSVVLCTVETEYKKKAEVVTTQFNRIVSKLNKEVK